MKSHTGDFVIKVEFTSSSPLYYAYDTMDVDNIDNAWKDKDLIKRLTFLLILSISK